MIRAVIKQGIIQPLDPLPPEWGEGHEVIVEESATEAAANPLVNDDWLREMAELTAPLNDPEEWARIEATLAEADRLAKALVRQEMELP